MQVCAEVEGNEAYFIFTLRKSVKTAEAGVQP